MPKMKTRKSAASRYKISAGGKVLVKRQGKGHILTKKSAKRKRQLRACGTVSPVEWARARRMLPYS